MTQEKDPKDQHKATVTLTGVVEQIIEPMDGVPERALIEIQGAEDLYSEIRIENALSDRDGQKVKLKLREKVKVTIETTTGGTEKMCAFHATASR
jgi:hypothetical protein